MSSQCLKSGMHTTSEGRSRVDRQRARLDQASISNMRKLDSFFREANRLGGLSTSEDSSALNNSFGYLYLPVTMERRALKDITFSDGSFIPKGTHVAAVSG